MKCPNCGAELSDGVLFCKECGCKIQGGMQKSFCRECGHELEPDSKFCSFCGTKVLTQNDPKAVPDDEKSWYVDEKNIVTVEPSNQKAQTFSEFLKRFWNKLDGYLKFCVITAVILFFFFVVACMANKPFAFLASIVQIGCLVASCGIHLGFIKTDKRWLRFILPLVILLMFSPYFADFKAKDGNGAGNDAVTETSVTEVTTAATTEPTVESAAEIVEAETEYVLADNEIRIDFSKYDLTDENYEDVSYRLGNLGFENISYRIQYDIVWGITREGSVASVSIAGLTDFRNGEIFKKDDPVVITYHMKSVDDPRKIDEKAQTEDGLESKTATAIETVSQDDSKATTPVVKGSTADDPKKKDEAVQTESGLESTTTTTNETVPQDDSKVSMPVMKGSSIDEITKVAKKHGLSIVLDDLDFGHGTKQRSMADTSDVTKMGLSLDVCYDVKTKEILFVQVVSFDKFSSREKQKEFINAISGVACPLNDKKAVSNWVKSNLGKEAKKVINGTTYELAFGTSKNLLFYTGVPEWEAWDLSFDQPVVVETEPSSKSEQVTRLEWADRLFSLWSGRCSKLEKMIKNNMNDPKSFDEISTKRYDIINEDDKKTVNDLLTSYDFSGQVDVNDVLILCEFTGKNKLGGTVKNTAIAVARYSSQTLEIIGYE